MKNYLRAVNFLSCIQKPSLNTLMMLLSRLKRDASPSMVSLREGNCRLISEHWASAINVVHRSPAHFVGFYSWRHATISWGFCARRAFECALEITDRVTGGIGGIA